MHWPITVASFRTWRGSQDYIARDPASDISILTFAINFRFCMPIRAWSAVERWPDRPVELPSSSWVPPKTTEARRT